MQRTSYKQLKKSVDTINQKLKNFNYLNKIEIVENGDNFYSILGNNELCLFSGTTSELCVFLQGYVSLLDTMVTPEVTVKKVKKEREKEKNLYTKELDNGNLMISISKTGMNTICKNRKDEKIWDLLMSDNKKYINLTLPDGAPTIKQNNMSNRTKNILYIYDDIVSVDEIDLLLKGNSIIFKKVKI